MSEIKDYLNVVSYLIRTAITTFFIPLFFIILINIGILIFKLFQWLNSDALNWTNQHTFLVVAFIIIPFVYLFWFYKLTLKKSIQRVYETVFKNHVNKIFGQEMSKRLINPLLDKKESARDFNDWFEAQFNRLPKMVSWVARKAIQNIPIVNIFAGYKNEELIEENENNIATSIQEKLNGLFELIIEEIVPNWTKFIVIVNIILIVLMFRI